MINDLIIKSILSTRSYRHSRSNFERESRHCLVQFWTPDRSIRVGGCTDYYEVIHKYNGLKETTAGS